MSLCAEGHWRAGPLRNRESDLNELEDLSAGCDAGTNSADG